MSFPRAEQHLVDVEIVVAGASGTVELAMPAWLPGSYKIRDFVSGLGSLRVCDNEGHDIRYEWVARNRIRVEAGTETELHVSYVYYAHERTVRHSHVDRWHAFLNPGNCLMYVSGREQMVHAVIVDSPWTTVSTPLTGIGDNTYGAVNYDVLLDSPIEIGNHSPVTFSHGGVEHELVLTGEFTPGSEWLVDRLKEIVQTAVQLWGALPYDRYVFFLQMVPGQYGGLEHARSQVSMFDIDLGHDRKKLAKLLGLLTHELFHAWNIKRIRPIELGPFDYDRENHSTMLWLAEGLTTYYDAMLSYRSGFMTEKEYLKHVSETSIGALHDSPGRLAMSVKQSSFLAWVKLYAPNPDSINRFPSYYLKGGVVFLLLDLFIVSETGGQKSLDDVLRALYRRYESDPSTGITEDEFLEIVRESGGVDAKEHFRTWIDTTDELPVEEMFARIGLEFRTAPSGENDTFGLNVPMPSEPERVRLGISVKEENHHVRVARVLEGSPAENAGIGADDEIVAIDGRRVESLHSFKSIARSLTPGTEYELIGSCDGQTYRTNIAPEERVTHVLAPMEKRTPEQEQLSRIWLARNRRETVPRPAEEDLA